MQPIYVTQTSSGSSPWNVINWHANPINVAFVVRTAALTSNWQIDVTLDDPTNTYPSTAASPTILLSSQLGGPTLGSTNANGVITQPFAAWRLTLTSTGGSATVVAMQSGIG